MPRDKDKEPKKPATPAANQTVDLSAKTGSELSTTLDFPASVGLQIKLSFGAGTINPYDLLGCVYKIESDGSLSRPSIPPLVNKDAKLVSQAITNSQRARRFIKKSVLVEAGIGPFVSASIKDESVIEATVTQIANYGDKYGDVIDWNRLISYKSIFATGTYVLITAFSDIEVSLTECKTFNTNADVAVGIVKVNGEIFNINENTSRNRVALANYAILDSACILGIENELKLATPTPKPSPVAAGIAAEVPTLYNPSQLSRKTAKVLHTRLWENLSSSKPTRASLSKIPTSVVKIKRR